MQMASRGQWASAAVEQGGFSYYTRERIGALRDRLASPTSGPKPTFAASARSLTEV